MPSSDHTCTCSEELTRRSIIQAVCINVQPAEAKAGTTNGGHFAFDNAGYDYKVKRNEGW